MIGAFFYPWRPSHNGPPHVLPSLGDYDPADRLLIRQQIATMQYAGIDFGIVSWWGQGSAEDAMLPTLMEEGKRLGFHWTVLYEPDVDGRLAQVKADLEYLRPYALSPLRWQQGKRGGTQLPAIFMYKTWNAASVATASLACASKWFLFCQTPGAIDQQFIYNPSVRASYVPGCLSVAPGFWHASESTPLLTRDLAYWRAMMPYLRAVPWGLVTTWNEFVEQTQVEPDEECGAEYVRVMREVLR